jgi:hypothetical protein
MTVSDIRDKPSFACRFAHADYAFSMTKDELTIQLIKIALGLAVGLYFIWWSLEVLHRLPAH